MNREQMIAWLALEGWEPGINSVHRRPFIVYTYTLISDGLSRRAAHNKQVRGPWTELPAPRGWVHMPEDVLRAICAYIDRNAREFNEP